MHYLPRGDASSPRGRWGICAPALPEVLTATIDAGQIYTDQTGRFPMVSIKGDKYIMILYDYGSNAILAQPIKD
jgi:hypothetical protein